MPLNLDFIPVGKIFQKRICIKVNYHFESGFAKMVEEENLLVLMNWFYIKLKDERLASYCVSRVEFGFVSLETWGF